MTTFWMAPEVEKIADELIPKYHRHLRANDVRMVYLFRDDVPKRSGKEVWGECKRISGLNAFLAGEEREDGSVDAAFFAIVISKPIWVELSEAQKVALVDHELCHTWSEENEDGETVLKIQPHSLEEFAEIVQRHGLWEKAAQQFLKAARMHQQTLAFEECLDAEDAASGVQAFLAQRQREAQG